MLYIEGRVWTGLIWASNLETNWVFYELEINKISNFKKGVGTYHNKK